MFWILWLIINHDTNKMLYVPAAAAAAVYCVFSITIESMLTATIVK